MERKASGDVILVPLLDLDELQCGFTDNVVKVDRLGGGMQCPKCRLISPAGAQRCDCGYDFETNSMKKSYIHGTPEAPEVIGEIVRDVGRRDLVIGGIWLALGAVATIGTYAVAAAQGGTYVVAYGAIVVGLIRFARGLYRVQTGRVSSFWDVKL
jgi:hypothetical protein